MIVLIASLWDINLLDYQAPIEHSNYKDITLKNFRGLNKPFKTLDGKAEFAFITTGLYTYQTSEYFEVKCYFYPSRSYTYKNNIKNENELLTHEIYHFHITEYSARLLRKNIFLNKNFLSNRKIDNIRTKVKFTEDSLQYLYDEETYHSYVSKMQIRWQMRVDSLLKSLEAYKSQRIILK